LLRNCVAELLYESRHTSIEIQNTLLYYQVSLFDLNKYVFVCRSRINLNTSSKKNKSSKAATRAKDHSIQREHPYRTTKQASKKIRYLQLSTNVNDYDTGETETATKKTESSIVTSKKTGDKFQDLEK
jgi:hypothetical protein